MKNLVVLSGAGISAESGLKTFRDAHGLWEGHNIMEVASPEGFKANPSLVLEFYNKRRAQLLKVQPNSAHKDLVALEEDFNVQIITQNVDDLHERAGSSNVLHLHGELLEARSTLNEHLVYSWKKDLVLGDLGQDNAQLRPHIVWFGEAVPLLDKAIELVSAADILVIIGTSMQVYPAAGLMHYCKENTSLFLIDPHPAIGVKSVEKLTIIKNTATKGMKELLRILKL